MIETFELGDIVEMKKQHPCGSKEFEVIRLGADIKIKCVGCGRIVMIPRQKFQKDAKKVLKNNIDPDDNFNPMDIYKILKLKPFECKMKLKPYAHIGLTEENWRDELEEYIKSPQEPQNSYDNNEHDLTPLDCYKIVSPVFTDKNLKSGMEKYAQKLLKKQKALDAIKRDTVPFSFLRLDLM